MRHDYLKLSRYCNDNVSVLYVSVSQMIFEYEYFDWLHKAKKKGYTHHLKTTLFGCFEHSWIGYFYRKVSKCESDNDRLLNVLIDEIHCSVFRIILSHFAKWNLLFKYHWISLHSIPLGVECLFGVEYSDEKLDSSHTLSISLKICVFSYVF